MVVVVMVSSIIQNITPRTPHTPSSSPEPRICVTACKVVLCSCAGVKDMEYWMVMFREEAASLIACRHAGGRMWIKIAKP